MDEVLAQVPLNVLVLIGVLILERLIPLRESVNPLTFFKALAYGITEKVHSRQKNNSIAQQKVAGFMALPTLLLPFLFLVYMLTLVAEFPLVFDALLLWMCLSWSPVRKDALNVTKALAKEQKSLAKANLDPWVLRATASLSPMGVSKTTIEMVMLRSCKEYFGVIFYYLIFGSFFMLLYRLMTLLGQCWNPKVPHYRHFGQVTQWICYLLDWLPSRFVSLSIMLLGRFKLTFQLMRSARHWQNDNSLMLLASTAAGLKVALGGPAIYDGTKIRRPKIANNQTRPPEVNDIRQAVYLVEKVLAVWLLVIILMAVLYFGLTVM